MDMIKKLLNWFKKQPAPEMNSTGSMTGLLNMLAMTESHEVACDDVSEALAEFAERSQQGKDITQMMPLVEKHLHMCPDCLEEYEALMTVLESEKETPEQS
ncbi:MAG: hypothetical protein ACNA70_03910 [Brevefilum sp.]